MTWVDKHAENKEAETVGFEVFLTVKKTQQILIKSQKKQNDFFSVNYTVSTQDKTQITWSKLEYKDSENLNFRFVCSN